jgi:hypothetical protein
MEAYCVKCRAKREIKDPKKITLKNGRVATQGNDGATIFLVFP